MKKTLLFIIVILSLVPLVGKASQLSQLKGSEITPEIGALIKQHNSQVRGLSFDFDTQFPYDLPESGDPKFYEDIPWEKDFTSLINNPGGGPVYLSFTHPGDFVISQPDPGNPMLVRFEPTVEHWHGESFVLMGITNQPYDEEHPDDQEAAYGLFLITVTPVPDPPKFSNLPPNNTFYINEDSTLTLNFEDYITCIDSAPTNFNLWVAQVQDPIALDVFNVMVSQPNAPSGHEVTFSPQPDYNNPNGVPFRVKAMDRSSLAIGEIVITIVIWPVNDPPEILSYYPEELELELNQNDTQHFEVNAIDVDGDVLTHTWTMSGTIGGLPYTEVLSTTHELDHTFLYPGFFTLTYEVTDGIETETVVWTITVKPSGPIFDPVPNPLQPCFPNGVSVTLSVPPGFEGATIYYTTDGSEPEIGGDTTMIYNQPIGVPTIPNEENIVTIKAFYYLESAPPQSQIVSYTYRASGKVADPIFDPPGGLHLSDVNLTIYSPNLGATIYYTTDGSNPDPDSPNTMEYTGPIPIPSGTEVTVKAIAVRRPCWNDSNIITQTYLVTGVVAINTLELTPPEGYYEVEIGSSLDVVVSDLQMTPSTAALWYIIDEMPFDNTDLPGPGVPNSYQYIPGTEFHFNCPTRIRFRAHQADWQPSGTHTFFYDVRTRTKILPFANGTVFDPAPHTSTEPLQVYINTETDPDGAPIYYTTDGSDPDETSPRYYGEPIILGSLYETYTIKAMAHHASICPSEIYVGVYNITGAIDVPQFDPVPSAYSDPQNVVIYTNTPGTTIYYTLDGTAPDQYSNLYTSPVHLGPGIHNLRAIAYKDDWLPSPVRTGTYHIAYLPPPLFSHPGGTYSSPIVVHLDTTIPDVIIRYSLTGAAPFHVYDPAVGIPVNNLESVTITAFTSKMGWVDSELVSETYNVTGTVAMPTFTPPAGSYPGAQNVTIATSTAGATIRWTLDGQEPSRTYGNTYAGPVPITESATLKAMAYLDDWADSPVNSGDYTIFGNIAKPVFIPAPGLYTTPVEVYISVNPPTASIYYTLNGDTPDASSTLYDGSPIQIDWDSTVTIKAIAIQSGWVDSEIAIGTYQVTGKVAAPVIEPPSGSYMTPPLVNITSPTPGATIYYTLGGAEPNDGSTPYTDPIQLTGNTIVKAIAYLADWEPSQVSTATYVINPQVVTPVFNPPAGTYQAAQNVSISSVTPGAVIRYTTDGNEPDETSPIYAGAIAVSEHTILRAKAYKDDHESSGIGTAEYFFMTANPVLTPPAGAYPDAITVDISTSTPGAQIRYTINGADPTPTSGTVWDGTAITIGENSTFRAIAYLDGWISSNVVIYSYVINGPVTAPYFSIAGGDYYDIQSVKISTLPPTASIYYTTDGSEPNESNGILYDPANPVQIDKITTLKARAYLNNWQPSPISEAQYNLFTRPVVLAPAGGTYPMAQMVTLSSPTPGAQIWYTLDDTNPIIAVSTEYDGNPIEIASTTTIKTVARAQDWFASTISEAIYIIDIPLPSIATPVIDPPSGVYDHIINVTITTSTPDAQIWYTIDGNDPNPDNGILYAAPGFSVDTNTTVHARAYKEGHQVSGLASAYYSVVLPIENVEMPTFTPEPGVYENSVEVTIATDTVDADIYYTTDGSAPTMSSNLYSGALNFTSTTQLRARAYKDGMNPSLIASGYYVINVIIPDVETPVFTPVSGLYHAPIDVTISTATPDATIRFTTDGTDPVASSPEYTEGIHVDNNQSLFIKARAFKDGHNPSPVASANYNVTGTVADIIFSVAGGTYQTPQSLILTTATPDVTIRYTTDDSEPTETSPAYVTAIPINSSKTVKARGFKTNWLPSAIGEETYIITGTVAFNQPILVPAPGTYNNAIDLAIAAPIPADAQVLYTLDGSDPTAGTGIPYTSPIPKDGAENGVFTIKAVAQKDGWNDANISEDYTFVASAPTFTPSSGSYTNAQNVVLASATIDATIRYTLDGSDPKISGIEYTAPIVIDVNKTILAYASKDGYLDSEVVSATYAIGTHVPMVATPVMTPASGTYHAAQSVEINVSTPDAVIYYTLDGSEPTETSTLYTDPIQLDLNTSKTIKAKAFKPDWLPSATATERYVITGQVAAPTFNPPAGDYYNAQNVVLLSATEGAYFRYTTDGSDPDGTSTLYVTPINVPVGEVTTIKARAYKADWLDSEISTATYNVTGKVAFTPPALSPAAGNYGSAQMITISAPIPAAATIRYTLDGSTPSATHGTIYTDPFSLDTTATVKAIAYLDGWADSDVVSAHYDFGVAAPVFSPVSGTYPALTVAITSATNGASIRYTLDGSEPSQTVGELYTAPMEMAGDATYNFKAIAYKDGWQNSIVVPATYNVTGQVADVTFSVPGGTYTTAQYLVLSSATPGAAIYYTTDGNEPTQSSTLYTTSITIPLNSGMVIRARAYRKDWLPSGITQEQYNVTGTTAFDQPHFTPAPGTYNNAISVSISQPIPANAQIYYTTDGTLPSADNGILYTGSIPMDSANTLRAVAIREGWLPSYISGNYDFMAAAPSFLPPAGSYESTQHVVLSSGTLGATIRYTTDGTDPSLTNGMDYAGPIVVNINQTIKAYAYKSGYQDSPITIATYAIGTYVPVVATPVFDPLPGNFSESVDVTISTATPDATIHYTLDGSNPTMDSPEYVAPITVPEHSVTTIKAIAYKEEWDASQIAVGTYNVTGTVSDVIFTPAGGNYQSAQQVVLTSLTDGAYFRYTLDGTEPTSSSALYTTAITVPLNSSVTITARAYKSGWAPSAIGSETYNVTGQVNWPPMVFTPAGGTYPAPVEVSIALPNPADATIHYTLDGSTPSATNGIVYTGAPIHIAENSTLKAIAFKEGWIESSIASASYQFGVAMPVFAPAAGTYQNPINVSISSATPAALIRYTMDGSNPTPEHGDVYLSPITLPEDSVTLFKAIAYLDNWNASAVATANYIITGKVADVTFSIPSGTYTTSQILVLNTSTPGASIYYTTDGSEPTQGSTLYTSAIIIPQNSQMTVKARAFRTGWIPSDTTTGVYNVTGTTAFATPSFTPAPGTYGNPINVSLGSAIPSDADIYYTTDGTQPSLGNGTLYSGSIPVNEALTIRAVAVKEGWVSGYISGDYSFAAAAPAFNPPAGSYPITQHVVLSSATVGALIRYTTDGTDPSPTNGENYTGSILVNINQTIKAYAYKDGYEDSPIAVATYAIGTYVPVVATPVFNPLPGNYVAPIDVTISTSTADATIRYTTDGSNPTSSSPVYTSAIHIPHHTVMTIKAIAYKDEWDDSQMAVATYSVTGTVEDVVFSPEGGSYTTAQNVVLTTPTPGAAIFYTLNGDIPTDASTQYTQAIQVPLNSSVTIKAVAYKNGWNPSSVGSQIYNITGQVVIPGQVFNPVAGTYTQPQIVTIATASMPEGATIRYTVNGDDPTSDSPEYTDQTIIAGLNAVTTVKARAFLAGWEDSPVYEAVYNVTGTITLPAVVFTPPAGTYQTAQNVSIATPTVPADVSLYYTMDGTDPTDASLLYQGPISLPLNSGITEIKVRAYKEGWVPSAMASATYNITGTIVYMTPVFLPPAGTYQTAQQITINSVNPNDATVRYTLDGSEPTQTSSIYTGPITLSLESGETTIKTKAFKTDWTASQTHSATYIITGQAAIAAPVFSPAPGTYINPQNVTVSSVVTPSGAVIRYTLDGSDPTTSSPVYSGAIPAPAYSTTRIKVRAFATDWTPSPVYEGIYVVNGAASINGVVFTPPAGTYTTAQRLVISTNTLPFDADIYYTIDGSDPTQSSTPYTSAIHLDLDREITVKVRAYGDQYWDPSPVYTAHYVMTGRVQIPEPVFSPDPSVVYTEELAVTIDQPIPAAATMRYTLDGSDPDESSAIYDGEIEVPLNTVMQIKARAYLTDWDVSPIYSATYTVSGKVELADQPFSPAPGIYTQAQHIAIAAPMLPDNAIIRYTINGDDPDETSVQYTGPITIPLDSDWQIKIRGFAPNWIPSDVLTAHYVVTGVVADPIFVVNGEAYANEEEYLSGEALNVILETTTEGAQIYYTMAVGSDPEEPTTASDLFDVDNPIVINELDLDVRIRAKAFKQHWIESEAHTHSFTVIPAPFNVRSLSYGGYIRLLWNSDITAKGLDGFNVYRRKTTESSWTKINDSLVNSKLGDDYYYDDYAIENRVSYVYRVTAVYSGKEGPYSNTTAIEYQTSELEVSSATHAYPNPATNSTTIKLMLTRNDNVTVSVSIYDFGGKKIRTITVPATNSNLIEILWDLNNSSGKKVGRGTYFARIIANDGVNKAERTIKISVK